MTSSQDNSTRILLAEDSPVIQRMISVTLGKLGCVVDTVDDGQAAVDAIQQNPYDLVLMDLRMPKLDGLEATRQIRQLDVEQPPIVALSGDVDPETVERCKNAGMNGHLTKPISMRDMLKVIRQIDSDLQ